MQDKEFREGEKWGLCIFTILASTTSSIRCCSIFSSSSLFKAEGIEMELRRNERPAGFGPSMTMIGGGLLMMGEVLQ